MRESNGTEEDIIAVYKEEGMTSHDVVDAVRRATGQRRVGHAGTLDPCAKGVLVVGIGRAATKRLGQAAGQEKEYIARIKLGCRSTTDDREGQIEQASVSQIPSEAQVRDVLKRFEGTIEQRPSVFSAVKVGGRAAYKLARARKLAELPARLVEAKEIELLRYEWPFVEVRIVTGPGFYVRSLARDLGQTLNTGGYLEALERTRVGTYTKEQAIRLADLRRARRDM
jgi:tRNA pseudouridine55 synthase